MGLLAHTVVLAQADTLHLTLDQALQIALSENPTIKVADEEIVLKKVAEKEAWQQLLPEAKLAASLDHTVKAPEIKLGANKIKMGDDGTNTVNAGLTVNLPLFAPTVYRTLSMSKTDMALAVEKARSTRQDLVNQVKRAYYQLLLSQDSYAVMQESYALAEENYRVVSAQYEQGKVSEFDKISAEVQLRSTRPGVVSAANAVTLAGLQLKVLLGITDVEVQLQDSLARYEGVMKAADFVDREESLDQNTTLRQLQFQRELLEKNVRLQRSNFLPTVGMSFSYQYQSLYNKNMNVFNYDWAGSSNLLFNISIPLFRASNFTRMKSAKLQLRQLDFQQVDVERKLDMEARSYRNNMAASMEQVLSNRENVKQAEKAVMIAGKRYEVGKGTVLELNSSQVSLTQAQLVYNQSIYDYLVAKADLDKVLGVAYPLPAADQSKGE